MLDQILQMLMVLVRMAILFLQLQHCTNEVFDIVELFSCDGIQQRRIRK